LLSARTGDGLMTLVREITQELESFAMEVELKIPYTNAGVLSRLHDQGRILAEAYESDGIRVSVVVPNSAVRGLRKFLLPGPQKPPPPGDS
jgi:GTP-binding protein HflX